MNKIKYIVFIQIIFFISIKLYSIEITFPFGITKAQVVIGSPSEPVGIAVVNVATYDESASTFGTINLDLTYTFTGSPVVGAHLHGPAAVGVANSGDSNVGIFALSVSSVQQGNIHQLTGSYNIASSSLKSEFLNGNFYLDIHSVNNTGFPPDFPGPELRGQMAVSIPEPLGITKFYILVILIFTLLIKFKRNKI